MIKIKKEKDQRFMFTVIGKPLTKKRARVGVGISKQGKKFRWATTPDSWYEDYIRAAFREAYPNKKPIGWTFCEDNPDMDAYDWSLKKGTKDVDLPKVELDVIFYFDGGKIGDLDNYIKAVKDALTQYAWIDDRQVKHYKPYILCADDFENNDMDAEPTRVDIYVKPFNVWENKMLLALRKLFARHSITIDIPAFYSGNEKEV